MRGDLRCIDGRLWRHDPQHDDPDLETDVGQCPDCSGDGCGDDGEPLSKSGQRHAWLDPREPDYSRPGIFRDHNCWKCDSGGQPCVKGNPSQCEYPHARND